MADLRAARRLSAGSPASTPTRDAGRAALVALEQLPAAPALEPDLFQVGQIVGPAVAGLVIAKVSLGAAYWIDVATFVVAS